MIGAVSTVAGILIAQFIGAVLISVLLILLAGAYTGLYRNSTVSARGICIRMGNYRCVHIAHYGRDIQISRIAGYF